ncbi:SDR family oxidoreductase [Halalkalibaculum sp. DA384]|uniref:SDR family oxidoreductase n=1 Tax=Halalkalibaculum sp. DA384 TaxID=3373606 RepID=UPI003754FBA0
MENTNLDNKVCLITGANSGIGKATAIELAERGAYIVMLCRNEKKAEQAREEIINKTGQTGIEILLADLAVQHDIRNAAQAFLDTFDQLDLLVNNAGIIASGRQETVDGIEKTLAVNHLAPFLLTHLLMDALKAAPSARVINVSSEAHRTAAHAFDLNNLQLKEGFSPMKAYGVSKLCNIMFTHELAKRTSGTRVTTNALHPGVVRSRLTSEASWFMYLLFAIGRPFMKSPQKGAETTVYLATSPEVENTSGKYFKNKKETQPADIAYNDELTEKLWEISCQLTGIE